MAQTTNPLDPGPFSLRRSTSAESFCSSVSFGTSFVQSFNKNSAAKTIKSSNFKEFAKLNTVGLTKRAVSDPSGSNQSTPKASTDMLDCESKLEALNTGGTNVPQYKTEFIEQRFTIARNLCLNLLSTERNTQDHRETQHCLTQMIHSLNLSGTRPTLGP